MGAFLFTWPDGNTRGSKPIKLPKVRSCARALCPWIACLHVMHSCQTCARNQERKQSIAVLQHAGFCSNELPVCLMQRWAGAEALNKSKHACSVCSYVCKCARTHVRVHPCTAHEHVKTGILVHARWENVFSVLLSELQCKVWHFCWHFCVPLLLTLLLTILCATSMLLHGACWLL